MNRNTEESAGIPTVEDILRGSAHALTVFKPGEAEGIRIYLKRGKPYLRCFATEQERQVRASLNIKSIRKSFGQYPIERF